MLSAVIITPIPPAPPNAWYVASFPLATFFATATSNLFAPTVFADDVVVWNAVVDAVGLKYTYDSAAIDDSDPELIVYDVPSENLSVPPVHAIALFPVAEKTPSNDQP